MSARSAWIVMATLAVAPAHAEDDLNEVDTEFLEFLGSWERGDADMFEDMNRETQGNVMGGSQGVVFMADSLRSSTLDEIFHQLDRYFEHNEAPKPIIIVANKVDVWDIVMARIRGQSVEDQVRNQLERDGSPIVKSDKAFTAYLNHLQSTVNRVEPHELLFEDNLEQALVRMY